jgi:hypothetical protein
MDGGPTGGETAPLYRLRSVAIITPYNYPRKQSMMVPTAHARTWFSQFCRDAPSIF